MRWSRCLRRVLSSWLRRVGSRGLGAYGSDREVWMLGLVQICEEFRGTSAGSGRHERCRIQVHLLVLPSNSSLFSLIFPLIGYIPATASHRPP